MTLARRRQDTPDPYPGIPDEDLTGGQRRDRQHAIVERYQGRKDREDWHRSFQRCGRLTMPFIRRRLKVPPPRIPGVPMKIVPTLALIAWLVIPLPGCATVTPPPPQIQPRDVVALLVQFHGAVADQFDAGGLELEHYTDVVRWIGDEIRVLQTNPTHWEGQARLGWPRVRSICVTFEPLAPWTQRIDTLLQ